MGMNWNRQARITIGTKQFQCPPFSAEIEIPLKTDGPTVSKVKLYNPSQETVELCRATPGTPPVLQTIQVMAGYLTDMGLEISGEISSFHYSESGMEKILEMTAGNRRSVWGRAVMPSARQVFNKQTASQILNTILPVAGVVAERIQPGIDDIITSYKVKSIRWAINDLAKRTRSRWYFKAGLFVFEPMDTPPPGDTVVLHSGSGLIGIPEKTGKGDRMKFKSLYLPRIQNGTKVQLTYGTKTNPGSALVIVEAGKKFWSNINDAYIECEGRLIG